MLKPITAKELPIEQAIFNDAWNMLKEFYYIEPCNNIAEWQQVLDKARELYSRGKGNKAQEILAQGVTMAVISYIEATSQNRHTGNMQGHCKGNIA